MPKDLTIVMYHYVRHLQRSRYPRIKGRKISDFRTQLNFFRNQMHPVTVAEVVHSVRTGDPLPAKAVLLTFDDGYIDHYSNCFPLLFDAGVQGAFFPPVSPIQHRRLLDVNRLHFTLAVSDAATLAQEIDDRILEHTLEFGLKSPTDYRKEWAKPSRFDDADTIYVKRMLQTGLPERLRNTIAADLFARHVSVDEATFADELYCSSEQLRVMQNSGMYVGSHSISHYWLNSVDIETQRCEIEGSLEFLRGIGSPVEDFWVMCYPYGCWDVRLLAVLRDHRCTLGLTTRVAIARLNVDDPLLLPRLDTNDFSAVHGGHASEDSRGLSFTDA